MKELIKKIINHGTNEFIFRVPFTGLYESIHLSNIENNYIGFYRNKDDSELTELQKEEALNIFYDYCDFKKTKKEYAKEYVAAYFKTIHEHTKIKITNLKNIEIYSPNFYHTITDNIQAAISKIDAVKLVLYIYENHPKEVDKHFKDICTNPHKSYLSFYKNKQEIIEGSFLLAFTTVLESLKLVESFNRIYDCYLIEDIEFDVYFNNDDDDAFFKALETIKTKG